MQISVQCNNSHFPSLSPTPSQKKTSCDILGHLQYIYTANNNFAVLSCIQGREWFALCFELHFKKTAGKALNN